MTVIKRLSGGWLPNETDTLEQRYAQLESVVVKLVRAHYDEGENEFGSAAKELTKCMDEQGKLALLKALSSSKEETDD